jgi:glycosyltransferase involved in cell wall biosynthesis
MNVLIIAPHIPRKPLSGGSVGIYHFAKRWSRTHRVTIVAPVFSNIDNAFIASSAEDMGVELCPVPVQIESNTTRLINYLLRAIQGQPVVLYYPEITVFLHKLIESRRFDVVDIEGTGFGGTLYLQAFHKLSPSTRVILTFYDVMWNWWKREFLKSGNPLSFIRWLTYRFYETRFMRQADCCVFMSADDRVIAERIVKPKKALVVPHGIETGHFPQTPVPKTKEVLFVGSFHHKPNIRAAYWLLNDIWPRLKEHEAGSGMTLVGLDPPPELCNMAQSAGIKVAGSVHDITPYYERSEVVVVPIQTGGGIRIKILEAGAAQRPVVTTRIGAEGLPIVPGMHAIIADSADDIVAGIRRLFHDRPLAQQLATNLHDLVEREFDWDKLAKQKESAFLRD